MTKKIDTIQIEEIRRRAKDNKADNARYFLDYSLKSLDTLRNVLYLSSFALLDI